MGNCIRVSSNSSGIAKTWDIAVLAGRSVLLIPEKGS